MTIYEETHLSILAALSATLQVIAHTMVEDSKMGKIKKEGLNNVLSEVNEAMVEITKEIERE